MSTIESVFDNDLDKVLGFLVDDFELSVYLDYFCTFNFSVVVPKLSPR